MVDQKLLILGTWNLASEIQAIAEESGWQVTGFVENLDRSRVDRDLNGLPILWIDDLPGYSADHKAVCGLSTTTRERFVREASASRIEFATIVHPTSRVPVTTLLGPGSIVGPGVMIGSNARLGEHVLINRGATIGHDTRIGAYTSVQPGVNIAGMCSIGHHSWIGIGANIVDKRKIGPGTTIGAGALVLNDLPGGVLAVGVPAVIKKSGIAAR